MVMHKNRSISVCLSAILLFLTFLSGLALSIPRTMAIHEPAPATDIVDVININVPVSCSMSATGTDSHTANVNNGQTTENIGTTNLKVICNDNSGYAIYAIGYTDDTYGKTVLTSSTLGSTHDIATATTVTTGTSSWAMKLASVSGTYAPIIAGSTGDSLKQTGDPDFSNYTAVPEEYTKVAYHTTSTDTGTNATGSNLTTTYRAYISPTQPAGTYIGQVKYTLVHPNKVDNSNKPVAPMSPTDCPANAVCYAPNASDIEGTMISASTDEPTLTAISSKYPTAAKQTWAHNASGTGSSISNSTTSITLIAPNYKRAGFGFAGWSTDFEADNSSTIYGPNETITITAGSLSTNGMILYPVWIDSTGNLQGWNGCSSLDDIPTSGRATLASMTALKDTRDDNVYTVAKLADGKCWMTENLRLNTEDSTNSNLAQGFGGAFTGLPSTTDSWNTSNFTLAQFNNNNTNLGGKNASGTDLSISHNTSNDHVQWYSYGNYYSWPAAIADTTAYNSTNGHTTVETSICPTGWHLPYGNNGNSSPNLGNTAGGFYYLGVQIGATESSAASSVKWRTFPNNFIYSGFWNGSSANVRGSTGYYWSSSASNSYSAYNLYFYSSGVYPGTDYNDKYVGFAVRCVAGGSGS
jgi:uncharacterized protein (TIGR02145 family)